MLIIQKLVPTVFMLNFNSIEKTYRPELNGLRAVAVLLVLLYHLDLPWMEGGFLGVDIFLVISGYFISKNILSDIQRDRFTFKHFYTKRLRRLFPALLATLLFTFIAGYFILTPASYERLGLSSIFAAISASNFFFWNEAGYFDGEAITKPLLHMWSLSLEEQFYLVWPFLLLLLFKKLHKFLGLFILVGILISMLYAETYYLKDPSAVFFLLPFRMFEFWMGALCIGIERHKIFGKNAFREVLFALGLVLMIGASVVLNGTSKMPGLLSLVPCVGAMMIIVGGNASFMSWTLRNKVMEYIGKASYSIYLVHWPLLVYYYYSTLSELGLQEQLILGALSIGLGFLMWYFVENTFRYSKRKLKEVDPVWFAVPFGIMAFSFVSYMVLKSDILVTKNLGELYMSNEELLANRKAYWQDSQSNAKILKGPIEKGHIIVMGNSHAVDLIYALRSNGYEGNITSLQTGGECYNFGFAEKEADIEWCRERRTKNLQETDWQNVDAIFLHDDWPRWEPNSFRDIVRIIRKKSTAPIYILGPKLTFNASVPEIVHNIGSNDPEVINTSVMSFSTLEQRIEMNTILMEEFDTDSFYRENDIHYIDILHVQGGENLDDFEVISKIGLRFLYFDKSHFTQHGSKEFGKKFKKEYPELFDWSATNP